jgi:arylsulfatase A-like enzyme
LNDGPDDEYLTERLANEACNYIEKSKSKPFFLNLWFYNVHTPLQAQKDKIDKYKAIVDSTKLQMNPTYAAMVEHVDDAVGKVIEKLKSEGVYDNTIIVFTSDNGGLIGKGKNKITNNAPLRDGKGHIYEGGVRVPLIIKPSGRDFAAGVRQTPVLSIDFLPTLVAMTDVKIQGSLQKSWDGSSLEKLVTTAQDDLKRKAIFWHYPHYHTEGATPYSAVRMGDWKLIHKLESDTYELYNLKNDIAETTNLAKMEPYQLKVLKEELLQFLKKTKAQIPVLNNK